MAHNRTFTLREENHHAYRLYAGFQVGRFASVRPSAHALVAAGVKRRQLYEDLASERRDDRPGLEACTKALREGDTLVVWKLDRLGRDLRHLVNLVHDLTARGCWTQGVDRSWRGDRHYHRRWKTCIRYLRRTS